MLDLSCVIKQKGMGWLGYMIKMGIKCGDDMVMTWDDVIPCDF